MLDDMEKKMPGRKDVMIRALGNVNPSHLLDPKLFDFAALQKTEMGSAPVDGGVGSVPNNRPPSAMA
jgi:hypothetical protein